jgi:hypothetical protein
MRRVLLAAVPLLSLLLVGCGDGKLRTKGQIVKDGAPYTVDEMDVLRITFVPIPEAGEKFMDAYLATFNNSDGTFVAFGKDGKGVPPGKYRIAVERLRNKKDLLRGAFDTEKSPFIREVKTASDTLVLDLAKPS